MFHSLHRVLSVLGLCLLTVSEVLVRPVSAASPELNGLPTSAKTPESYQCNFSKGGWSADDWEMVKRPLWDHLGGWVQGADHIANEVPSDATEAEMVVDKAPETYTGMVLKQPFQGNLEISSEMSFDYRMAPSIIIANRIGANPDGRPEHRDHLEICLFDKGVNIWRHTYIDGKDTWVKLAWSEFKLRPKKKYTLHVTTSGTRVAVTVDRHTLGCTDPTLTKTNYVGIVGDEGRNRFYDFKARAK